MDRVTHYMRRLGYMPWATFQLQQMHWNCERVREVFLSTDCLFRQTGRTTKGLIEYIAAKHPTARLAVQSPFGYDAGVMLQRRCADLLEMLGMDGTTVVHGPGGYSDHHKVGYEMRGGTMRSLHRTEGLTHNWNVYSDAKRVVTCLECLTIGPLPRLR